jgi:hypothetical protein
LGEYGGTFLFYPDDSWNKSLLGSEPFTDASYLFLKTSDELTVKLLTMLEITQGMIVTNGLSGGMYIYNYHCNTGRYASNNNSTSKLYE